jgi:uroporphyrinogen decarboxylase
MMRDKPVMTSRERVLCALNHEEPDRVPIFFGTSGVTTMLAPAYERLKDRLGVKSETRVLSRVFQYALIDEEVLARFGSDGRPLLPRPTPSVLRHEISDRAFVDEWGITWEMKPGSLYFETTISPLQNITSDDIDSYPWPDLTHPDRFKGMAAEARALHEDTPYAVVALSGTAPFEQIGLLRGLATWLLDLAANPEFAQALMRKVTDLMLAGVERHLDEVGAYIDVLVMGDDLGTQSFTLISPEMYRRLIKPFHAELIAAIKRKTSAKIFFHTDGNIYALIGDFIDIGVDLLNPVQVSAGDMGDTARLKREFGHNISFCGAIDTHRILPTGTPDDVRREVRRRIKDLGPGGGYILASVHCLQPDVPLENIYVMFEEALVAGQYPLA